MYSASHCNNSEVVGGGGGGQLYTSDDCHPSTHILTPSPGHRFSNQFLTSVKSIAGLSFSNTGAICKQRWCKHRQRCGKEGGEADLINIVDMVNFVLVLKVLWRFNPVKCPNEQFTPFPSLQLPPSPPPPPPPPPPCQTYLPIHVAYSAGSLGMNSVDWAVSTSTAPKQSASITPNVQWKYDSCAVQRNSTIHKRAITKAKSNTCLNRRSLSVQLCRVCAPPCNTTTALLGTLDFSRSQRRFLLHANSFSGIFRVFAPIKNTSLGNKRKHKTNVTFNSDLTRPS